VVHRLRLRRQFFERGVQGWPREACGPGHACDPTVPEVARVRSRHQAALALVEVGEQCCVLLDRKSTRLNSSHEWISYAVFCLKHPSTPELCTLSLHDALPIYVVHRLRLRRQFFERGVQGWPREACGPGHACDPTVPEVARVRSRHQAALALVEVGEQCCVLLL